METVTLPRPFVEELLRYFMSLPFQQSEFVVGELRAGLNPDEYDPPHAVRRVPIVERIVKDEPEASVQGS